MKKILILSLALLVSVNAYAASPKAKHVRITDSGAYYTGTEVETALQELGAGTTFDARYVNLDSESTNITNGTFNLITTGSGRFDGGISIGNTPIADTILIETSTASDPTIRFKSTNTAHEIDVYLDESATGECLSIESAGNTDFNIKSASGSSAGVHFFSNASATATGSWDQEPGGLMDWINNVEDADLLWRWNQGGVFKSITIDGATGKWSTTDGTFDFTADAITTTGPIQGGDLISDDDITMAGLFTNTMLATDATAINIDGSTNDYTGTGTGSMEYVFLVKRDMNAGTGHPQRITAYTAAISAKHTGAILTESYLMRAGEVTVANSGTWTNNETDSDVYIYETANYTNINDTANYDSDNTKATRVVPVAFNIVIDATPDFTATGGATNRYYPYGFIVDIDSKPTLTSGSLVHFAVGGNIDVRGHDIGTNKGTGLEIYVAGFATNYDIYMSSPNTNSIVLDGDNAGICWGEVNTDLRIYSDGDYGRIDSTGGVIINNKLAFTQTDRNEYIDSLNDGYMDYGATTGHRFNTDTTVTGTLEATTLTEGGNAVLNATELEGTAILSTGEEGAAKFLREDGDGTSSWQAVAGGGATYREYTFLPHTAGMDATNPAIVDWVTSSGTGTVRFPRAKFDDGDDDVQHYSFTMPSDATASAAWVMEIYGYSDEDVDEDVILGVQVSATTADDADNVEEQAADTFDYVSVNCDTSEAKALIKATLTIDYANCDGAVAGDEVNFIFLRDGDGTADTDDHTNEFYITRLHLKIPRS